MTDYYNTRKKAKEMGVDANWAVDRRKEFLNSEAYRDYVKRLERQKRWVNCLMSNYKIEADKFIKSLSSAKDIDRVVTLALIGFWNNQIKECARVLSRIKYQLILESLPSDRVTDEMILKAKEYPIENLLPHPIERNKTLCPFHNDKNPSLGIKNNVVHCFACGTSWDTIELIKQLNGLNFVEAVKQLTEG